MSGGIGVTKGTPKSEFIPASEYTEAEKESDIQELIVSDWDEDMQALANQSTKRLSVPRNTSVNRAQVVSAFTNAFELIGGVPRLALWAHTHPTDFYKLYSRLLPSQASSALGESTDIVIKHVLPRGVLDE